MNKEMIALSLTLVLGLFLLLGSFISLFMKKKESFTRFSIGLAFGVMIIIVVFDLLPEAFDAFVSHYNVIKAVFFTVFLSLLGSLLLKIFDYFIPHHENDNCHDDNHHNLNLYHIGIMTSIALILHNIIEGMAIYSVFLSSLKTGILLMIGVGFHNIPLGMIITSTIYKENHSKRKTLLISLGISIATFLGGIIIFFLQNKVNETILGGLLALTLGMIIYIALFELLPEILEKKDRKLSLIGVFLGILLGLISIFGPLCLAIL